MKKDDGEYSVYVEQIFNKRHTNKKGESWVNMSAAGGPFEQYMYERLLSEEQANKIMQFVENAQNKPMTQWLNTHSEFAATTGVKTYGRSDLAVGSTVTDDTVTELRTWIDLETTPPAGVTTGDFLLEEVVKQGVEQNLYGFQLKTYQEGSDDKRWQNSAVFMNLITNLMEKSEKTWSQNYAVNFPVYILSKYLINIINPINVATITPSGLEYATDMLSKYRFYMEVTWDIPESQDKSSPERGGGYEVFPRIA